MADGRYININFPFQDSSKGFFLDLNNNNNDHHNNNKNLVFCYSWKKFRQGKRMR